jgi:hypothetical protein
MSSNMSVEAIHVKLDSMNQKDEKNIKTTYSVGFKVEFLDVYIENCNGTLVTSVSHKPAAEPYVLPYSSDHPRHIQINISYEALLRAARLCSHVHALNKERLGIEMIVLLNGYPQRFIKRHVDRFFRVHQVVQVFTELDPLQYDKFHQKVLYLPTRREKKYQRRTSDENSEHLYDNDERLATKQWNKKILMFPHTYESGPLLDFKREFRKLWAKSYAFKGSVMKDVRLVITILSNPSLNDLLVHKKPSRSLLAKMGTSSSSSEIEDGQEQEL